MERGIKGVRSITNLLRLLENFELLYAYSIIKIA